LIYQCKLYHQIICSLRVILYIHLQLGSGLLCSNFYLLCFWVVLKNVTHYAQYYTHNYFNYATVHLQILLFLMTTLVCIVHFIIIASSNSSICNCIGAYNGLLQYNLAISHLTVCQKSHSKFKIPFQQHWLIMSQ